MSYIYIYNKSITNFYYVSLLLTSILRKTITHPTLAHVIGLKQFKLGQDSLGLVFNFFLFS